MEEIVAIELDRYKTRIAVIAATDETVKISSDRLYEMEPIIDYILSEQIDKITEFFLDIKQNIGTEKRKVYVSLPDYILRIDLRETDYVDESRWDDEFSKAIKAAIPQLAEEPHCFTYPLVIPLAEQDRGKRCYVTTVSLKRKFINALISSAKNANVRINNINATSIAISRYIDRWDKPYLILRVEHDRSTLAVSFSQRGIDLVHEALGWGEMLNSNKGIEKILQILSLQNSRIRSRGLSQLDQSPLIVVSEKAEEIKDILSQYYDGVYTIIKPSVVIELDSGVDNELAITYAASIGLSLHYMQERRNGKDASIPNGGSNSSGRVRGTGLFAIKTKVHSLLDRCRSAISNRANL